MNISLEKEIELLFSKESQKKDKNWMQNEAERESEKGTKGSLREYFKLKDDEHITVKNNQNTNFRLYPEGKKLQLSFDYQIWLERDTFIVTHWHKSEDKWYVILKNGSDLFCNDVREIVE
jgi:hypothetical protein